MTSSPRSKRSSLPPVASLFTSSARLGRASACQPTRATDRGVSPVVGAILMFALALGLLAIVQAVAIPPLNEAHEFQHNERVQADFIHLDGTVDRTAATGSGESARIEAGLRYPPRMFFINPPPVVGTIRPTGPAMIEVTNVRADGEASDYWNGTGRHFETRSVVYSGGYNEYTAAPTTVYESWVIYNRFDGTSLPVSGDGFIDGRRISLVMLDGGVSTSTVRSVSLDVESVSAPVEPVTVRADGDPITITVPTNLPEDVWESLIADELDPAADPTNDRYVTDFDCLRSPPAACERLTVTLEPNASYELRLGKVSLGGTVSEPEGTYLVDVAGDDTSIPENGSQKLVVEVRDRFDNRVSGVRVNASLDGDGTLRTPSRVTGDDGRVSFVYEAPDDVMLTTDVEIVASFGQASPKESATFTVRIMDLSGPGGGTNEPAVTITTVDSRTTGNQDRFDVSVDADDVDADLDRVEFELQDSATGAVIDQTSTAVSGTTASVTERLTATGTDRRIEYRIVVVVFDEAGNSGTDERTVLGSG